MTGLQEAWELARVHVQKTQRRQQKAYNQTAKPVSLCVGDWVYLHVPSAKQGKAHKFARPFKGPYHVLNLYDNGADIRLVDHPHQQPKRVTLNRLQKCPRQIAGDDNCKDVKVPAEALCKDGIDSHQELLPPEIEETLVSRESCPADNTLSITEDNREGSDMTQMQEVDERALDATNDGQLEIGESVWAGRLRKRQTARILEDDVPEDGEM